MKKSILSNRRKYSSHIKYLARKLRKSGRTHREIMKELGISSGSAVLWTRGIILSQNQRREIYRRRVGLSPRGRCVLANLARTHLVSFHFQQKYTREDLLERIRSFYQENGRIPLKREFNSNRIFRKQFGSWNKAIEEAGFQPNKSIFSRRVIARDGHTCDSFGEMIVDNYLSERNIRHERSISYPHHAKLKVDFVVEGVFIEYFGLAGEVASYDKHVLQKKKICEKHNIRLVEIYPSDIFDS